MSVIGAVDLPGTLIIVRRMSAGIVPTAYGKSFLRG